MSFKQYTGIEARNLNTTQRRRQTNVKKLGIGLLVAFVAFLVLPMVAQAQVVCTYVGPLEPLEMNTVVVGDLAKTIKVEKEIFECTDERTGEVVRIVEIENYTIIVENFKHVKTPDDVRQGKHIVEKIFQVTHCIKEKAPDGTWYVVSCRTSPLPSDPFPDVKACGPPIPINDPVEMNTVTKGDLVKTIKVNKEIFRCRERGDPLRPLIYEIEIFEETFHKRGKKRINGRVVETFLDFGKFFEVSVCVKDKVEARKLACKFVSIGKVPPFGPVNPGWLRPELFVTELKAAKVQGFRGQLEFVAQGTNIASVQVTVYDQRGRQVFSGEASGNSLSWSGLNHNNSRLANGVYFYVMTIKGHYGQMMTTKVQKFALLR